MGKDIHFTTLGFIPTLAYTTPGFTALTHMLIPPEFTTPEFTTLTHILIISTNVKQKLNLKQNLTPHLSIAPITKDIHFTILRFILPTLACTTPEFILLILTHTILLLTLPTHITICTTVFSSARLNLTLNTSTTTSTDTTECSTDSTDSTADTPHTPTSTTKDITTNNNNKRISLFFYLENKKYKL